MKAIAISSAVMPAVDFRRRVRGAPGLAIRPEPARLVEPPDNPRTRFAHTV